MRSSIDTIAAAAAYGRDTRFPARRDLRRDPLGERTQRFVAHGPEAEITFLCGQVPCPEHGTMVIPVRDEAVHEAAHDVEPRRARPRPRHRARSSEPVSSPTATESASTASSTSWKYW